MVLQALEDAANILAELNINKAGPITQDVIQIIKDEVKDETIQITISPENAKRSITLSQYFLSQKKFLSGYSASGEIVPLGNNQLARKILLNKGKSVTANSIKI